VAVLFPGSSFAQQVAPPQDPGAPPVIDWQGVPGDPNSKEATFRLSVPAESGRDIFVIATRIRPNGVMNPWVLWTDPNGNTFTTGVQMVPIFGPKPGGGMEYKWHEGRKIFPKLSHWSYCYQTAAIPPLVAPVRILPANVNNFFRMQVPN
jgi:hypothetical protein